MRFNSLDTTENTLIYTVVTLHQNYHHYCQYNKPIGLHTNKDIFRHFLGTQL